MQGCIYTVVCGIHFLLKMSKKSRKDEQEREDATSSIMALLTAKLAENKEALLAAFSKLEAKLDNFQITVNDHCQRIVKLGEFADAADSDLRDVQSKLIAVLADNAKLKARLTDLEGRSRHNNVRIVGLPEDIEGPQPTTFFSQLLLDVLGGDILASPPELDRAHRTLAAKPGPSQKPRPTVICFHRYQTRELVVRAARKLRG